MDSDLMRWVKAQADDPNANPRFRELLAALEAAREERDELAKDAAKYRWGINNARWIRSEQEAYVAIPVAPDADLSCVAMRDAAIDQARGKGRRVKREDVEALHARVLRDADNAARRSAKLADMTFNVEGDILDALCRAWLALDGAPSVEVTECNQLSGTPDFDYGDMLAAVAGLPIGTTVRIVPEDGQEVGK